MSYRLIRQQGAARRGEFVTVHGTVQTPAFMNVATAGAIKGGLSAYDLKEIRAQVMLCNTYHLHLRPGDETVAALGGLHKFTRWDGPILTDSGGFQVFSLAKLQRKVSPFIPTLMDMPFSWDLNKVCRFRQTWVLRLRWLLTSVSRTLPNTLTQKQAVRALHGGCCAAKKRWRASNMKAKL